MPGVLGGSRLICRFGAAAGCLLLAGALAGVVSPPAAAAARGGQGAPSVLDPALFGVAGTSTSSAWAVGQYQSRAGTLRTLIVHWNGTAWTRVPSPDPAPGGDTLNGVAATSAGNAWAVGGKDGQPLIVRWDGTAWRQVTAPALPGGGTLAAVAATSATSVWAVGFGGHKSNQIVIMHWNGTAWQMVPSPVRTGNLYSVAATSATDAWAVGSSGTASASSALTEHWNGTAWTQVPCPNPPGSGNLLGVAAASPSSAWAVSGAAGHTIGTNKTVIDHWNGTAWTRVPSPNPVPGGAILLGVAAASATDGWAVGIDTDFVSSFETVIEHWNGTTWTLAHSPIKDGSLYAVAATSAANAWAVGGSGSQALIEHWNGIHWSGTTIP